MTNSIKQELRVLAIVRALQRSATYPVPIEVVHAISYMCDALAPVWELHPLHDVVLKTRSVPRQDILQHAIDRLVGRGMLIPSRVSYERKESAWQLQANYALNEPMCERAFVVADTDMDWKYEFYAIREISVCVTAVGLGRISEALQVEASYSDPTLDEQNVIDLEPDEDSLPTPTVTANRQLSTLAFERVGHDLTPPELTRLYVRHLFSLMGDSE